MCCRKKSPISIAAIGLTEQIWYTQTTKYNLNRTICSFRFPLWYARSSFFENFHLDRMEHFCPRRWEEPGHKDTLSIWLFSCLAFGVAKPVWQVCKPVTTGKKRCHLTTVKTKSCWTRFNGYPENLNPQLSYIQMCLVVSEISFVCIKSFLFLDTLINQTIWSVQQHSSTKGLYNGVAAPPPW